MYVYLMPEKGLKTKKVSEDYGMLTIKTQIASAILTALPEGSGLDANEILDMLEYPPDLSMGDLAFPCFKLSRSLRKAPPVIAAMIGEGFSCPCVESASVAGGYLNFKLSTSNNAILNHFQSSLLYIKKYKNKR